MLWNMDYGLEQSSSISEDSSTFVNGSRQIAKVNTKHVDNKRLAIDLSALKHLIWDNRDDCDEEVDGSKGDYSCWIDTSAILSDCLTKTMTSRRLNETLSTGIFDMRPTEERLAIKAKNTKWRASKKEQERLQDLDG